jgi:NadR type nicotinamide-nucleotide adenylyltransferase
MNLKSNLKNKSTGMVLGKFMPPHLGHLYLIDFARTYVDDLTVVVGTLQNEPIPGNLRYEWIKELFPSVRVLHLTDENPQDPSEHPDFWNIWQKSLTNILPFKPDYVFASEDYGWKLAEILEAKFIPVNRSRSVTSISASKIRQDPFSNWEYIPRLVRPYFIKRVCIFGAESTGKTTLAKNLAKYFNTVAVPEYAREYLEAKNGKISFSDIPYIAYGQIAAENALAYQANRLLFCDTDLLTTKIWSEVLFGKCPQWIQDLATTKTYDLYLLTDVDVPWVEDIVRYLPNERESFLERCKLELTLHNRIYVKLSGSWEKRFEIACEATTNLIK